MSYQTAKWLLLLPFLALMCRFPALPSGPTQEAPDATEIAARVQATLTALASEPEPAVATATPSPTVPPTPTEAPMGPLVVYTDTASSLALVDASGSIRRLTTMEELEYLSFTRDGQWIVFKDARGVWRIRPDGTEQRLLLSREAIAALHPVSMGGEIDIFSMEPVPGQQAVLFNTWEWMEGALGLPLSRDLFHLDLETGTLTRLLDREEARLEFAISPGGRYVVLLDANNLDLARLNGARLEDIRRDIFTFEPVLTYTEAPFVPFPLWASTGDAFGIVLPPQDMLAPDPEPVTFWRIGLDGSVTRLGQMEGDTGSLSPDFRWVVVHRGETLWLARSDGSGARVYEGGGPMWSPDSRYFAGIGYSGSGEYLSIGRVDGPPVNIPLGGAMGRGFVWITGGTFYLWLGEDGNWRLVRGRVDGTMETLVSTYLPGSMPAFAVLRP